jgi:hypothetical protein
MPEFSAMACFWADMVQESEVITDYKNAQKKENA